MADREQLTFTKSYEKHGQCLTGTFSFGLVHKIFKYRERWQLFVKILKFKSKQTGIQVK